MNHCRECEGVIVNATGHVCITPPSVPWEPEQVRVYIPPTGISIREALTNDPERLIPILEGLATQIRGLQGEVALLRRALGGDPEALMEVGHGQ